MESRNNVSSAFLRRVVCMFHPYRRQARPKRRSLQIIECDKDKYMVCMEYIYNRNHGALLERERFLLSNFDFIIIIRLQWHKSFLSGSTFSICGTLLVSFIDGLEKWRGEKLIPIRPKTFYQNVICTYSEQRKWRCHSMIKRLVIFGHVYRRFTGGVFKSSVLLSLPQMVIFNRPREHLTDVLSLAPTMVLFFSFI